MTALAIRDGHGHRGRDFRAQSGQTPTLLSDPAGHNGQMKTLLNIIWFVFGGFWLALGYFLAGIICCLLIVTIPWGIASFRIAAYTLWPFGRMVVDKPGGSGVFSLLGNVIWLLVAVVAAAVVERGREPRKHETERN